MQHKASHSCHSGRRYRICRQDVLDLNQNNLLPPPRRDRGVCLNATDGRSSDITGRSLGQVAQVHCGKGR